MGSHVPTPSFLSNIFITEAFAQDQASKQLLLQVKDLICTPVFNYSKQAHTLMQHLPAWLQNRAGHQHLALIQSIGLVQISPVGCAVVCIYVFDVFSGKLEVIV